MTLKPTIGENFETTLPKCASKAKFLQKKYSFFSLQKIPPTRGSTLNTKSFPPENPIPEEKNPQSGIDLHPPCSLKAVV